VIGPLVGGWLVTPTRLPVFIINARCVLTACSSRTPCLARTTKQEHASTSSARPVRARPRRSVFRADRGAAARVERSADRRDTSSGIAVFGGVPRWQRRTPARCCPLGLFRLPNFSFANPRDAGRVRGLSTLTFFLVLFLQQLAGYTALNQRLALIPIHARPVHPLAAHRAGCRSLRAARVHGLGPLIAATRSSRSRG